VLVGGVIDHQVHHELHPPRVQLGDQLVDVGEGAERGVDVLVVADVVAVVVVRRPVHRREPDHVDAELVQIVQARDDPRDVADAVAVRILEAAGIDLVDDGGAPPLRTGIAVRHAPQPVMRPVGRAGPPRC